ncbi:MAG: MFS transporter [Ectothiorhodospiraceae bacterium]|nr:MFS transporter [Ectothiorhodospiraceae bacterium]
MKTGFHPSFWVANVLELFERFAYYGQAAVFAVFARDVLGFSEAETGSLDSLFGFLIYFLPIFAGTFVDKYGFKKSFMIAFALMSFGYFAVGSTGMEQFAGFYEGTDLYWMMTIILIVTAIGGSFIKPSVLGTVSRTSKPHTKSLGFAIYYMLVNAGAAIGPLIAFNVRGAFGMQFVFAVSAGVSLAMLIGTIMFFKEPPAAEGELGGSLVQKLKDLVIVLANFRFMIFLLIFSIFWIMFWQTFLIVPWFVTDTFGKATAFEVVSSSGAWAILLLQIPVNRLTKKLSTNNAIILGFFISAMSWLAIALSPTLPVIIGAIAMFAIGEMTQAPRYYEYIADIAPKGQIGLYQGYAFLPIALGKLFGGVFGGFLYQTFANAGSPQLMWFTLTGVGLLTVLLMWVYNMTLAKGVKKAEGTE